MKLFTLLMVLLLAMPMVVFGEDPGTGPVLEAAADTAKEVATTVKEMPAAVSEQPPEDIGGILQGIIKAIGDWKQIGWQAGLAALLMVLLGTMKNSLLRQWLWDKLPQWSKVFVAPFLSIIIFALGMEKFGWTEFFAAITTGAAAVYLHQMVKALSEAPFVGGVMKSVLDFVAKLLKKPDEKVEA